MFTIRKLTIILLVLNLLFIMPTAFAFDDDDDSGLDTKQQIYHVYADIDLIPTTQFQYAKSKIVAKSIFPQLSSDTENENVEQFNSLVKEVILNEFDYFKQQVVNIQFYQSTLPKTKIKNDLYIDFDTSIINTKNNPILSIRFTSQGFVMGLAHPYHRHSVINYDLGNGEIIELSRLFKIETDYLGFISDYTSKALVKRLKNTEMIAK